MSERSLRPPVTIIGAGVSGLSCGVLLTKAGHPVTILTKDRQQDLVSSKAAAIWFPYHAGMSAKNLTTVAYTALAFPVFAFAIDYCRGKTTLAIRVVVAVSFIAIGFVILVYGSSKAEDGL